ncbi:MAG: STAS domain-containing protein [Planctomycetota bacterium]
MATHNGDDGISISSPRSGAVVVSPQGEVDLVRSPQLQTSLQDAMGKLSKGGSLIVDLSGVTYMDSSGVATLVQGLQLSRKKGVDLTLCALQDRVRSIFEIARLDTVFRMTGSLDEALSASAG